MSQFILYKNIYYKNIQIYHAVNTLSAKSTGTFQAGYFLGTNGAMLLSVFSRLSGYRNEYVGLGKTLNRASVLPLSNE